MNEPERPGGSGRSADGDPRADDTPRASQPRASAAAGRGGLGRGLDALIRRTGAGVQEVEIERIVPNPAQPRQFIDPEALEELAASVRKHGILQPVIVARSGAGYALIAGERRWRAAQLAGLPAVPAIVRETSPRAALEIALVENLQRADLTPLEEAAAYRDLTEAHGLTQEQVALQVGRSRVAVTNRLRLLSLPERARSLLADGSVTEGHARALLGCPDPTMVDVLAVRVVAERLSVRQTEELVRRATAVEARGRGSAPQAAQASSPVLEEELQRALGTRVEITRSRRGGRLVIHYYSDEQLEGIVEAILGAGQA
ncbi:MAG: ParB/RepB/Spo0J family partition protein [Chloroflexi bacterium]|nr:ParB/RepB/Spo0J family partition protein [Chloroflexota bacterium]